MAGSPTGSYTLVFKETNVLTTRRLERKPSSCLVLVLEYGLSLHANLGTLRKVHCAWILFQPRLVSHDLPHMTMQP